MPASVISTCCLNAGCKVVVGFVPAVLNWFDLFVKQFPADYAEVRAPHRVRGLWLQAAYNNHQASN
jgi:hypothetical protein